MREPETILEAPALRETLDLSQPVALSLVALLHFIPDEQDAHGIVNQLLSALAPGSALVITHLTGDFDPDPVNKTVEIYRRNGITLQAREKGEVEQFFSGLQLVEPGVELLHRWRPDLRATVDGDESAELQKAGSGGWAGVALKP